MLNFSRKVPLNHVVIFSTARMLGLYGFKVPYIFDSLLEVTFIIC